MEELDELRALARSEAVSISGLENRRETVVIGVVAAGVCSLETALASEQTKWRHMVVEIPSDGGILHAVGNPIRIDGWECDYRAPPLLDEHADLVRSRHVA